MKQKAFNKHRGFNKEGALCKSFGLLQCWTCTDERIFSWHDILQS
jgi:hypothetical protein